MAISKEIYQISTTEIAQLVNDLNFILQRMSDRFDKLEGLRGDAKIRDTLDVTVDEDANIVHGFNTND